MRGNSGWRERCRQRPVSQRDPIEARKQGGLSLVLDLAGSYKEMANSARPARRSTALAFNSKSPSNRPSCSMIQLCGCFAMASSHCSTVNSVGGNKAGTVSEPLGSTPNICTIAGSKPRAKRVGYVLGSGFRSVTAVPVKVGLGVTFIEGAYAGSNDNAPCLKGSRTMAEVGSEGCPGQAAPQPKKGLPDTGPFPRGRRPN